MLRMLRLGWYGHVAMTLVASSDLLSEHWAIVNTEYVLVVI